MGINRKSMIRNPLGLPLEWINRNSIENTHSINRISNDGYSIGNRILPG